MQRLLALTILLAAPPAAACTTFCVRVSDGLVFGRNFDYVFGQGMVLVNPRGVDKISLLGKNPARWTSKYGSVTFNQYGKDSPMGGMNEPGLAVELMELEETRYPEADSKPALSSLEWIQYLLDNFASVEEAIQGAKRVRIGTTTPLHFLLADRTGDSAAVEFLKGRMVVHRGERLPDRVLANSTYVESRDYAERTPVSSGELPRGLEGSLERFARASRLVRATEAKSASDVMDCSFEILDAVAQPGLTQWQVVYDLPNATIHYRTAANRERRSISAAALDFSCRAGGFMFDVDTGRGNVTAALIPYAPEANEKLMLENYDRSPRLSVTRPAVRAEAAQVETRRCATRA